MVTPEPSESPYFPNNCCHFLFLIKKNFKITSLGASFRNITGILCVRTGFDHLSEIFCLCCSQAETTLLWLRPSLLCLQRRLLYFSSLCSSQEYPCESLRNYRCMNVLRCFSCCCSCKDFFPLCYLWSLSLVHKIAAEVLGLLWSFG